VDRLTRNIRQHANVIFGHLYQIGLTQSLGAQFKKINGTSQGGRSRNMKQNLTFAFLYNSMGIPIAAGLLYPFTGWLLSPMIAAVAMSLSSVSVIVNALRLR
jgi:hypothetical protein